MAPGLKINFTWLLCLMLWIGFKIIQPQVKLLNAYLDDVLFLPIVLGFALQLQRNFILKNQTFTFSKYLIAASLAYTVLVFEIIFPAIEPAYTFDYFDILAYLAGALFFARFMNVAMN